MRRGRHAVPNMTLRPSGSTTVTTTSSTLNGEAPRLSSKRPVVLDLEIEVGAVGDRYRRVYIFSESGRFFQVFGGQKDSAKYCALAISPKSGAVCLARAPTFAVDRPRPETISGKCNLCSSVMGWQAGTTHFSPFRRQRLFESRKRVAALPTHR